MQSPYPHRGGCDRRAFPALVWASQVELVVKNPPVNAGKVRDAGSIPGSGRSPGEGNDNPLQYSCQGNPMNRGAWWAIVHGVTKSWTRLSHFTSLQSTGGASDKDPVCQCRRHKRPSLSPWVGKIPWRKKWQPTSVFLPGKSHEQRSLEGYSP